MKYLPNTLTASRILLALAFPFIPFPWHWLVVLVALITEFLDGFLARSFGWTSSFGALLDPIADKLFFLSVALTWIGQGYLSWADLLLLGIRDVGIFAIVVSLKVIGHRDLIRPIPAHFLGKLTTALQYLVFLSVLLWGQPVDALLGATAVTGAAAALQYFFLLTRTKGSAG